MSYQPVRILWAQSLDVGSGSSVNDTWHAFAAPELGSSSSPRAACGLTVLRISATRDREPTEGEGVSCRWCLLSIRAQ